MFHEEFGSLSVLFPGTEYDRKSMALIFRKFILNEIVSRFGYISVNVHLLLRYTDVTAHCHILLISDFKEINNENM